MANNCVLPTSTHNSATKFYLLRARNKTLSNAFPLINKKKSQEGNEKPKKCSHFIYAFVYNLNVVNSRAKGASSINSLYLKRRMIPFGKKAYNRTICGNGISHFMRLEREKKCLN